MRNSARAYVLLTLATIVLCLICVSKAKATDDSSVPTLEGARASYDRGEYKEAIEAYKAVLQEKPENLDAILGLSDACEIIGEYETAMEKRLRAVSIAPKNGRARKALGEIYYLTGKHEKAEEELHLAIKLSPPALEARLLLGILRWESGRKKEANEIFEYFIDYFNRERDRPPDELLTVGMGSKYYADFSGDGRMYKIILQKILQEAVRKRPRFLEAHLAMGNLMLDAYNYSDASEEFRAALKINPNHPDAHLGVAYAKFASGLYAEGSEACAKTLLINPNHIGALQLRATIAMSDRDYAGAISILQKALAVNPNSVDTHCLLASCYYLQGDTKKFEAEHETVQKLNPKCAEFYHTIGEACSRLIRLPEAISWLERALKLDPQYWPAEMSLGMAYMRAGDNKRGRVLLEKAFDRDPYNVRAYNLLNLTDRYDEEFVRSRSEHFTVVLPKEEAPVLWPYVRDILERSFSEYSEKYRFVPSSPITVEFFNRHADFSARTTGLPQFWGVGACFGTLITMDSPSVLEGRMSWGGALRHEFAHVIAIQKTDYLVPRWLTEGISTYEEKPPMAAWDQLLVTAADSGSLASFARLNNSFTHPRQPGGLALAYCQSYLAVSYIVEKFGFEKVVALLNEYKKTRSDEEALSRSMGIGLEEFGEGYDEFVQRLIDGMKIQPQGWPPNIEELEKKVRSGEADIETHISLARSHLAGGDLGKAEKTASEALKIANDDVRTLYVRAKALLGMKDHKAAQADFEKILEIAPDEYEAACALGHIYHKDGKRVPAVNILQKAKEMYPDGDTPYALLAEIFEELGAKNRQAEELQGLVERDNDNYTAREKLGQLYHEAGEYQRAADVLLEAILIQPFDMDVHKLLGESLWKLERAKESLREYNVVLTVDSKDPDALAGAARAQLKLGNKKEAIDLSTLALVIDSEHKIAKEVLINAQK